MAFSMISDLFHILKINPYQLKVQKRYIKRPGTTKKYGTIGFPDFFQ